MTQGGAASIAIILSMVLKGSERLRCAQSEKVVASKVFRKPAQRTSEKLREARRYSERRREAQRGSERLREAQRGSERLREAQKG